MAQKVPTPNLLRKFKRWGFAAHKIIGWHQMDRPEIYRKHEKHIGDVNEII